MDLTRSYLVFGYLTALGTLQLLAIRHGLRGLSLWDVRRRLTGYLLGGAIFLGGTLWFFMAKWDAIFIPGPAGGELVPMLAVDMGLAAATLLAGASLIQPVWMRRHGADGPEGQEVSFGPAEGRLHLPQEGQEPFPGVCLLANPLERGDGNLALLAQELVQRDMAVLTIQPRRGQMIEELDAYGLLPAGIAYLSQVQNIDARRIVAVGSDLGGDLVIRALAKGHGLLAGVALAPRLGEEELGRGLTLLRELTLPRAFQWTFSSQPRRLAESLGAKPYLKEPEMDNLLIIHGEWDGLVPLERVKKALSTLNSSPRLISIGREDHLSLSHSLQARWITCGWLAERLRQGQEEWKPGT